MDNLSFITESHPVKDYIKFMNMFLQPFGCRLETYNNKDINVLLVNKTDNEISKANNDEIVENQGVYSDKYSAKKSKDDVIVSTISVSNLFQGQKLWIKINENIGITFISPTHFTIYDKDKGRIEYSFKYVQNRFRLKEKCVNFSNRYNQKYERRRCTLEGISVSINDPDITKKDTISTEVISRSFAYIPKMGELTFEKAGRETIEAISIYKRKGAYIIEFVRDHMGNVDKIAWVYNFSTGGYAVVYTELGDTDCYDEGIRIYEGNFNGDISSMVLNNKIVRDCINEVVEKYKSIYPDSSILDDILSRFPFTEEFNNNQDLIPYFDMIGGLYLFDATKKSMEKRRVSRQSQI